jgi:hypothetical protein
MLVVRSQSVTYSLAFNICLCNRFVDGEKTSAKGKDDISSGDEEEKKFGSDSEDDR